IASIGQTGSQAPQPSQRFCSTTDQKLDGATACGMSSSQAPRSRKQACEQQLQTNQESSRMFIVACTSPASSARLRVCTASSMDITRARGAPTMYFGSITGGCAI